MSYRPANARWDDDSITPRRIDPYAYSVWQEYDSTAKRLCNACLNVKAISGEIYCRMCKVKRLRRIS